MRPHNPGRGRTGTRVDPFAVLRDETGLPVVDESLAVITPTSSPSFSASWTLEPFPRPARRANE